MKKAIVFLANGFEEMEALGTVDILRRGGIEVTTVSITANPVVTGAHNVPVTADTTLEKANLADADALVLPGGMPGASNLNDSEAVKEALLQQYRDSKIVAAICAAPMVLGGLGLLKGRNADAIELSTFGGIQCAFTHGGVVDVGTSSYFCKYHIPFRVYRDVDHDLAFFLDGVSRTGQASGSDGTTVQVERTVTAYAFVCSVVGVTERTTLVTCSGFCIALTVAFSATDTECSGNAVADGLFFLATFFFQTFLFSLFTFATVFFLFPFTLFFFLFLLFLLLGISHGNTFFDVLRNDFLLRCLYRRSRWRGRRGRFLWQFLSRIFGFEGTGCGIDVSEIDKDAPVFFRNLRP